jgi:hypothetical protein
MSGKKKFVQNCESNNRVYVGTCMCQLVQKFADTVCMYIVVHKENSRKQSASAAHRRAAAALLHMADTACKTVSTMYYFTQVTTQKSEVVRWRCSKNI